MRSQPSLCKFLRGNGIVSRLGYPFIFTLPTITPGPLKDHGSTFISAMTRFVNLFLSGKGPPQLAPWLCVAAPLTALQKRNGGIRPIAVGETLRRLVSSCAMNHTYFKNRCELVSSSAVWYRDKKRNGSCGTCSSQGEAASWQ